jgi:hypothetical protein
VSCEVDVPQHRADHERDWHYADCRTAGGAPACLGERTQGVESLLILSTQDRLRLEEDVRQADQMVARIRPRLFPLIDKEIEKINPNP